MNIKRVSTLPLLIVRGRSDCQYDALIEAWRSREWRALLSQRLRNPIEEMAGQ